MLEQDPLAKVATASGSKPSLQPLTPISSEKPTNFLTLPRELRDKVYAYLLSTEYNKHGYEKPQFDSMRCDYTYRFHTSILYTNQQINNEASQAFYMNNLFIHISCGRDQLSDRYIALLGQILAEDAKAQPSKHHAMEIYLLSEGEVSSNLGEHNFIVTCNELPALCRGLLFMGRDFRGTLASTELRLIIREEVGLDEERAEEDEATENHTTIESSPAGGDLPAKGSVVSMNRIRLTSSRVRRLLEPFRALHSIRNPQIIGPLSEEYKTEVTTAISKSLPSSQHLFDQVLTTLGEAINTFDSGDFASSISELRNTLDELGDAKRLHRRDVYAEIIRGPYAGFTVWEACKKIELSVWTKLAWACLKTDDLSTADHWLIRIFHTFMDGQWEYGNAPPGGHDIAMVYYLEAQLMEERDRMGHSVSRLYCLWDVIGGLEEGLRHEPGNSLLAQELEERELELAKESELYDLMNMADRLDPKSEFEVLEDDWYIPGWIWNQKG